MKFSIVIFVLLFALIGCVHERVIYRDRVTDPSGEIATQEPPEVIQERVTVAPSPIHIWIGGHWAWRRGAYDWAPGYWASRPHPRAYWAPGGWVRFGGGWRWRHGYWR
jgi:WXXGXW repeat (2 copies)